MITHPFLIALTLLLIELVILKAAKSPRWESFFKILPFVFWVYALPMVFSVTGLIDGQSPIYGYLSKQLLPVSLFLLLIGIDIKAVLKLGAMPLIMMMAGSAGIIIGTVVVFGLGHSLFDPRAWSGFGALAGSWMGGSANMIAVKEAINTPDDIFFPMVVVDTIVPYVWMGGLVVLAAFQPVFDRWTRADCAVMDELAEQTSGPAAKVTIKLFPLVGIVIGAFMVSALCRYAAGLLPEIPDVMSRYGWLIILITCAGIACSFTKLRQVNHFGANRMGYLLLYFVLTTIGARADLSAGHEVLLYLIAGFVIVLIHGLILVMTAKMCRAPLALAAAASQANLGGVASAPIVAEIYRPGLASVGLLMAIWGNVTGTYLGLIAAQLCRFISSF